MKLGELQLIVKSGWWYVGFIILLLLYLLLSMFKILHDKSFPQKSDKVKEKSDNKKSQLMIITYNKLVLTQYIIEQQKTFDFTQLPDKSAIPSSFHCKNNYFMLALSYRRESYHSGHSDWFRNEHRCREKLKRLLPLSAIYGPLLEVCIYNPRSAEDNLHQSQGKLEKSRSMTEKKTSSCLTSLWNHLTTVQQGSLYFKNNFSKESLL